MIKISIAMATYNGAQYINEQLQSLVNQVRQPDELVVCDDGSTDETLLILESFVPIAPFPVRIYRNEINLGYSDNFLKAAKLCKGDWIAFCDQDDVWLSDKIKTAVEAIDRHSGLKMVLQNAELCDGHLNRRGRVFPNKIKPGVYGSDSQYGFWVWPGFLKTVRADWVQMIDSVNRPLNYFLKPELQTHDKWTCMIANSLGDICVLAEPVALYRRHEGALTGSYTGKSIRERIDESKAVNAKHYRTLSEVAVYSGVYLERVSAEVTNQNWQSALARSAKNFNRFADIQNERAALYESQDIAKRVACYMRIWRKGGYFGPRFRAMGMRSAGKDSVQLLCGSRIWEKKAK